MLLPLLAVNSLLFILRLVYVVVSPFDLSPEEAQYWDWSRHLDLSYYSKPPLVAYLNWLSTHLLGNTELAVRIWPATFAFLSSVLAYFAAKEVFKSERTAFWIAVLPNLFVGYDALAFLFTTDVPLFFFWGLSFYLLLKAVEKNDTRLWLALGLSGGLGFLSKYSMVLFFPLGVLYLLLTKPRLLLTKGPYLAAAVAFLFTLPVLYWNYEHGWVSFKHVLNLSGVQRETNFPDWASFFNFLLAQVFLLSVVFFPFLLKGWLKNLLPKKEGFSLTLFSLPGYAVFQLLALKKFVYGNWAAFAYFTGGILALKEFLDFSERRKALSGILAAAALFLVAVSLYPPLLDRLGLGGLLPPKNDPTKFLVGWSDLGREVSEIYDPRRDFVFSNLYQIAAELAFYTEGNPRTFVFNHYQRMNQYTLWQVKDFDLFERWLAGEEVPPEEVFNWEPLKGKNGVFVTPLPSVPKPIADSFERVVFKRKFVVRWRGYPVRTLYIFYLENFKGNYEPKITGF
ncbi:MAG: glycosyltransferase family 39 protein [Aquificae bacterium]|nr:glycosyltransferase family 39 protein [Aquificota bacterium]